MRKLLLTTATVAAAIGLAVAGEPSFGTFTDTRDGQTYKTVKIGKQAWMARNLNYKPQTGNSWCYDNKESNCKKYGRLYDWETAKTVCPTGWALPEYEDWYELVATTGGDMRAAGKKLKAKSGWIFSGCNPWDVENCKERGGNGTDEFGFSALPSGVRHVKGRFYRAANYVCWWTNAENDEDLAYGAYMDYDNYRGLDQGEFHKSDGRSVRCVADNP
jgi:uncharacterized protein (TIGR02145 family)